MKVTEGADREASSQCAQGDRSYSEGPRGRKYWVPFTGFGRRRTIFDVRVET
jgi:hypothetical protein